MRVNQHQWAGGPGARCLYCGTVCREDGGSPLSCYDREVAAAPQRHGIACEDSEAIAARLAELAAYRQEILNAPAEAEEQPVARAESGAIDPGDCCV